MNLRDFEYVVAVDRLKHFGKAAMACHVSQPTLSMQISKLEDYLGVRFFERVNKKVIVTAAGKAMLERARNILALSAEIEETARQFKNPFSGEVALGVFPTLAPFLLPVMIPALAKQFPAACFRLIEEKTDYLMDKLHRGELDLAILAMPGRHESYIESVFLFRDPFFLAISKRHPMAAKVSVDITDLRAMNLLLLEEGHCLRDQALSVCSQFGALEQSDFRATSLETLRQMVIANNGVTLIPRIARGVENEDIKYLPFKRESPYRDIGMFFRTSSPKREMFESMAVGIKKMAQELWQPSGSLPRRSQKKLSPRN